MRVVWSKQAERLLDEIHDHIAESSPGNAAVFAGELGRAPRRLAEHPRSVRVVPELDDPELLEIVYRGYRILYRIEDVVEIIAVANGRQDLNKLAEKHRF